MPKGVCPACETKMKKKTYNREENPNKSEVYVCPNCKGAFIPDSIFGVT